MNNKIMKVLSLILIAMFVLSACAPAATATQAPAAPEATKAPEATTAPEATKAPEATATTAAAAKPTDYLNAPREDTFIIEGTGRTVISACTADWPTITVKNPGGGELKRPAILVR